MRKDVKEKHLSCPLAEPSSAVSCIQARWLREIVILALSIVTSFRDNATSCELFRLSFIGRCLTHSVAEATQANRWRLFECQP
jgi:hypothetical protein